MWCQQTQGGQLIDDLATLLVYAMNFNLNHLLNPRFFFSDIHRHSCYLLAGSFTGFLIRRYGWNAYCSFYRNCDSVFLLLQFKQRFGVSLEQAEQEWRRALILPVNGQNLADQ